MKYEKPELEIIKLDIMDVITASPNPGGDGPVEDDDYFD